MNAEARSNSFSDQLFAFTTLLATSMPSAPNSRALITSLLSVIPAPQIILVEIEFFASACKESVIINGLTFETAFPEPINSGGSTAIKFGYRSANSATS